MKHLLLTSCLSAIAIAGACLAAPVRLVDESPVSVTRVSPEIILIDFGRVSFANIHLMPLAGADQKLTVHFGEDLQDGRINRNPLGTVRYASTQIQLKGTVPVLAAPRADQRNTQTGDAKTPPAVLTPPEWGVLLPFRWVEIEGWPGEIQPQNIVRKSAFASTWDNSAASFESSDKILNQVWELCRYSIKATTFAGIYVDGDRERIPYEADAYLNQLSHYATDNDIQMARDTFDHLIKYPTWPTEWSFHMIFMAYADYQQTGDIKWLSSRYQSLKPKLLQDQARGDGLLVSNEKQVKKLDLVDWPAKERDGFVMKPINTVVNAFYIRALHLMAEMATTLGKEPDAAQYTAMEIKARTAFHRVLFDATKGAYRDGEGTNHLSQHASLFPLAFGLTPAQNIPAVLKFIHGRKMACSVYAAQYLMEGLLINQDATSALELITAPTDRSWRHMVESGATITWEAWDLKYKPNQDWNHAWGAAPANVLPRFILGAEPLTPGWKKARLHPQTGNLTFAKGKIPTPNGPITVDWKNDTSFQMKLSLPDGMAAKVEVPAAPTSRGVKIDGNTVAATRIGSYWHLNQEVSGSVTIEVDPS